MTTRSEKGQETGPQFVLEKAVATQKAAHIAHLQKSKAAPEHSMTPYEKAALKTRQFLGLKRKLSD